MATDGVVNVEAEQKSEKTALWRANASMLGVVGRL